jgi:glutathione S-transferase
MQAINQLPAFGHAHRVELVSLQLPTELILVDLAKGEHKQAPYLAINSFGQVLAIDDDGVVLADSNAILVYPALKYGNIAGCRPIRWVRHGWSAAAGPIAFELLLPDW